VALIIKHAVREQISGLVLPHRGGQVPPRRVVPVSPCNFRAIRPAPV